MLSDYALIQLFQREGKQGQSRGAAQFPVQHNGFPSYQFISKKYMGRTVKNTPMITEKLWKSEQACCSSSNLGQFFPLSPAVSLAQWFLCLYKLPSIVWEIQRVFFKLEAHIHKVIINYSWAHTDQWYTKYDTRVKWPLPNPKWMYSCPEQQIFIDKTGLELAPIALTLQPTFFWVV